MASTPSTPTASASINWEKTLLPTTNNHSSAYPSTATTNAASTLQTFLSSAMSPKANKLPRPNRSHWRRTAMNGSLLLLLQLARDSNVWLSYWWDFWGRGLCIRQRSCLWLKASSVKASNKYLFIYAGRKVIKKREKENLRRPQCDDRCGTPRKRGFRDKD